MKTEMDKTASIITPEVVASADAYFVESARTGVTVNENSRLFGKKISNRVGYSIVSAAYYGLEFPGGTVSVNGELGILGGVFTRSALGDATLGIALTRDYDFASNPYRKYQLIKLPIPKEGNPRVRGMLSELESTLVSLQKGNADGQTLLKTFSKYYFDAIIFVKNDINPQDSAAGYDYLLLAILYYDNCDFIAARRYLGTAGYYFDKRSVIKYMRALVSLAQGDRDDAKRQLSEAVLEDPKAIQPYILWAQMEADWENFAEANAVGQKGLSHADGDKFALELFVANINYYKIKDYLLAKQLYLKAASDMPVNEFKAECLMMAAKSCERMHDYKEGESLHRKALETVKSNSTYLKRIEKIWAHGE